MTARIRISSTSSSAASSRGGRSRQDAVTTANWNAPGICAHQSAMQGGARVEIPAFDEADG